MKIKTVMFDLDGTLLPMEQEDFVKAYFGAMAKRLAPHGFDPQTLIASVWKGTEAMVRNDGTATNEAVFWAVFSRLYSDRMQTVESLLNEFYEQDFPKVASSCGCNPLAAQTVRSLKEKGYRVVLATNPIFPAVATYERIRWAGLTPEDFELVTTYEHSHYCKPNPDYYREILEKIGCVPEECLMVGNDVGEDMVAKTLGMQVFLLTDNLINAKGADISSYPQGSFAQLNQYIAEYCQ